MRKFTSSLIRRLPCGSRYRKITKVLHHLRRASNGPSDRRHIPRVLLKQIMQSPSNLLVLQSGSMHILSQLNFQPTVAGNQNQRWYHTEIQPLPVRCSRLAAQQIPCRTIPPLTKDNLESVPLWLHQNRLQHTLFQNAVTQTNKGVDLPFVLVYVFAWTVYVRVDLLKREQAQYMLHVFVVTLDRRQQPRVFFQSFSVDLPCAHAASLQSGKGEYPGRKDSGTT
uniref:Uncharacterized protein n=1 Tax=mine drainage metagenome TaxID=410659 RepID=E6QLR6_9ZZZZ